MATVTAQILIGRGHPYHDGIEPSHRLYFLENTRPSLVLFPEVQGEGEPVKVTWIPTLENALEDALLMIAIHVIKDPEIVELASQFLRSQENNWVVLYEDISPQDLEVLYQRCRALDNTFKLVVTVLRGSHIEEQLKILHQYKMDLEVCRPNFVRLYSNWLDQTRIEGEL
ncbi:MAG: hypothetical protein ACOX2G_07345 [Bacillota bacterium]